MTFWFVKVVCVRKYLQIKAKNMNERIHSKVDGCPLDIQEREPLADGMPAFVLSSPSTAGFNTDM